MLTLGYGVMYYLGFGVLLVAAIIALVVIKKKQNQ